MLRDFDRAFCVVEKGVQLEKAKGACQRSFLPECRVSSFMRGNAPHSLLESWEDKGALLMRGASPLETASG